jgi:hypothetical protein
MRRQDPSASAIEVEQIHGEDRSSLRGQEHPLGFNYYATG